ncbi:tyrosine-type recombinase/integrase [Bacillus sp. FJAT-45350]|uniref:tyrosine-type recombinase/integrase n=1 Tax=Bacillus sp. FJAT-45350 TaxID=2011014 RepID=UPI000BB934C9|nr:tyrosine-type recombinase/integrase [Bacillus sp. FJAT-45350]
MNLLHDSILPSTVKEYLTSLEGKRQPSTVRRYFYDLEDFFKWLAEEYEAKEVTNWLMLTTEEIKPFFWLLEKERKYNIRTTKRIATVLNQLYKYSIKQGVCNDNPIDGIELLSLKEHSFQTDHFITEKEAEKLFKSVKSMNGLTENQEKSRHFLVDRNISIFLLFLSYGLTLQELTNLKMKDIHFENNTIYIASKTSLSRTITINENDKVQLYTYFKQIPEPVRPRYHSHDPFFVSFDFQRNTYRWLYELDQPKALTEIAIQKMIREEVKRAGLRKGISAKLIRHTFILNQLSNNVPIEDIQRILGLKTPHLLQRYIEYSNLNS